MNRHPQYKRGWRDMSAVPPTAGRLNAVVLSPDQGRRAVCTREHNKCNLMLVLLRM